MVDGLAADEHDVAPNGSGFGTTNRQIEGADG